ncbi:hypothetical protein BO86DRAFT_90960 [Aspergillus japonicus CBS 114.51]|uniref:Hydrophobin n=2 Tax=Aspergillus TaxID=5052 RepID=A0A2V5GPW6_ASPV1|nr:hypothetical protein BO86DRAFT_90960 [Aspergillus japonicus CBS 114.51]PYI13095.1 hypothetical protein BO99DRAFT_73046 [Aspergillus violaceofuscus CBS 115571]RAH81908.1 hypothetical protein BO86DRAFT_90960 [Aspergillus japonicus CBS 114.51]
MKFSLTVSILAVAGLVAAVPAPQSDTQTLENQVKGVAAQTTSTTSESTVDQSQCIAPVLCCGTLTTPLDPLLDPILADLDINAGSIVGSVGLLCKPYDTTCTTKPQCCSEVNLLNGVLALGCSALEQ